MNSIPCLSWVKRGASQRRPDKVTLTAEELSKVIASSTKDLKRLNLQNDSSDEEDETEAKQLTLGKRKKSSSDDEDTSANPAVDQIEKEYGLADYDDESEIPLNLGDYASVGKDQYNPQNVEDSDDDDMEILPEDNVLAVGKVNGHFCNLEVYVYNEAESNIFCHHEIILPSFPLCMEWLSFDPGESAPGSLVAIGNMTPDIEIWDLNVIDSLEPAFTLEGSVKKYSKKKKKVGVSGHSDAVLDLSWNRHQHHVLASASADFTVGLWDLEEGKMVSSLNHHKEKVQCVEWHTNEKHMLLSGSFDKTVKLYDCHKPDQCVKSWKLQGEVEKILWNHHNPAYFFASCDTGRVYGMDVRTGDLVFDVQAHAGEVTGLALSSTLQGCMVTCSVDKTMKVWDLRGDAPKELMSQNLNMGKLFSLEFSPDSPLLVAAGGEEELRVINLGKKEAVAKAFGLKKDDASDTGVEEGEDMVGWTNEDENDLSDGDDALMNFAGAIEQEKSKPKGKESKPKAKENKPKLKAKKKKKKGSLQ